MKVPYVNLAAQYAAERESLLKAIDETLTTGTWIGGDIVGALEDAFARYVGVRHAVAVASGTDALMIGMMAAGVKQGDEVITAPNSFAASTAAIANIGAVPVFADVGYDELIDPDAVEAAITTRTAAIMPVHLRGSVCQMDRLGDIARKHGLAVIEDAAQSFGSKRFGTQAGAFGAVGCFSLHPLKGLNACGDAGVLTTNSSEIAEFARLQRNHGLRDRDTVIRWGTVSRLDPIQAAIVLDRMRRIETVFGRRRRSAGIYRRHFERYQMRMTSERSDEFHTFNTFVIQTAQRDALQAYLTEREIGCAVHYKIPLHLQPAAAALKYRKGQFPVTEELADVCLSIPVHQAHDDSAIEHVASSVCEFLDNNRP